MTEYDARALDGLRRDYGDETVVELIDLFLSDSLRLLTDLRDAAAAGDAARVRLAAHSLKSTSLTLGAGELAALCQELEDMGGRGSIGRGAGQKVSQAAKHFAAARKVLEQERAKIVRSARGAS